MAAFTVQKGDIVALALRKATLASASMAFQPDAESIQEGLEDMEAMLALWLKDKLNLGYLFSDNGQPSPGDDSGIELAYKLPVALQLARQMLIDNNRDVPPELALQATNTMDMLRATFYQTVPLKRRNDMPTGAGNDTRFVPGRFYNDETGQ